MNSPTHRQPWRSRIGALCAIGFVSAVAPAAIYAGTSLSQNKSTGLYTMKASDTTVKDVLSYIEKNSTYVFLYGEGVDKKLSTPVSIQLKDKKMDTILAEVCKSTGLQYKISGRQVTITTAAVKSDKKAPRKVSGVITDKNGEPLIGATVMVKGTNEGAITDLDGRFTVNASQGQKIQVTYVGFNPETISVGSSDDMKIEMNETDNTLNEVVVIGYGTVKKKDLTGAVASVKGDELASKNTTTLSTALQGSISGLMVRRDNNAPGASASSMHVRGVTTKIGRAHV